jgi:tetratricopeptide (TPR) repeat protein
MARSASTWESQDQTVSATFDSVIEEQIRAARCVDLSLHRLKGLTAKLPPWGNAVPSTYARWGRELGVSYVLEGSIRRFKEGTLRITAQLTETESGTHVWAERYDRPAEQLFEIQDDLVAQVGSATHAKILEREKTRHATSDRSEIALWRMKRRLEFVWTQDREVTAENFRKTIAEIDAAIEFAPENVWLIACKAEAIAAQVCNFIIEDPDEMADVADVACALAREAVQKTPDDKEVLRTAGNAFFGCGRYEEGFPLVERALRHDPYSTWTAHMLAFGLIQSAKDPARGVALLDDVLRRDPFIPSRAVCLHWQANALAMRGDFEKSVSKLRDSIRVDPLFSGARLTLAKCLVELGRADDARVAIEEVRRMYPALTLTGVVATVRHMWNAKEAADWSRAIGTLWDADE